MKRALAIGVLAVLAFAPAASADIGPLSLTCNGNPYIVIYENGSFSGDSLVICRSTNYSNLASTSAGLTGTCTAFPVGFNNWNNCISSIAGSQFSGSAACIYTDTNYSGSKRIFDNNGDDVTLVSPWNDAISSIRWDTTSPYSCVF